MEHINWGVYLLAVILLTLSPGPDMLYVISRGLSDGRSGGVISALGLTLGVAFHALLAAFGLSALLAASETAYTLLRLAGAAYLVWIGIQLLRARGGVAVDRQRGGAGTPASRLFWQGTLSAVANPKLAVFFLAFLPQFVPAQAQQPTVAMLSLGLVFIAVAIPIQAMYGYFAGVLADWLAASPAAVRRLNQVSGVVILGLGLRLAFAERH